MYTSPFVALALDIGLPLLGFFVYREKGYSTEKALIFSARVCVCRAEHTGLLFAFSKDGFGQNPHITGPYKQRLSISEAIFLVWQGEFGEKTAPSCVRLTPSSRIQGYTPG